MPDLEGRHADLIQRIARAIDGARVLLANRPNMYSDEVIGPLRSLHAVVIEALDDCEGHAHRGGNCPFCGKDKTGIDVGDDGLRAIRCRECGATGPDSPFIDEAIGLWGARGGVKRRINDGS